MLLVWVCHNFYRELLVLSTTGCLGFQQSRENVKIGKGDAVRIAVNDSATLRWIDNCAFQVVDVGAASISIGDGVPEEVMQ